MNMRIIGALVFVIGCLIAASGEYALGGLALLLGASIAIGKENEPEWTAGSARTEYVIQANDYAEWHDLHIEVEGTPIQTKYAVYNHAAARVYRLRPRIEAPLRIVKRTTIEEEIEGEGVTA